MEPREWDSGGKAVWSRGKRHCLAGPTAHVAHLGMWAAGVGGEVSAFPGPCRWPSCSATGGGHPGPLVH